MHVHTQLNFKIRHTKKKGNIHIIFIKNGKKLHLLYERSELIKESIS
jgi:REP element-mobilizing transposase RayT